MIKVPKEKIAVIEGLQDYIVIDSDDVLLICSKQEEQNIRQYVNDIKIKKDDKYI